MGSYSILLGNPGYIILLYILYISIINQCEKNIDSISHVINTTYRCALYVNYSYKGTLFCACRVIRTSSRSRQQSAAMSLIVSFSSTANRRRFCLWKLVKYLCAFRNKSSLCCHSCRLMYSKKQRSLLDNAKCHSANCHHRSKARKLRKFCPCGKCSSVAIFEHSCPLAYGPQTLYLKPFGHSDLVKIVASSLNEEDDFSLLTDTALLPSERLCLITTQKLLQVLQSCDKEQCFHSMGDSKCTYLKDERHTCITFFIQISNENVSAFVTKLKVLNSQVQQLLVKILQLDLAFCASQIAKKSSSRLSKCYRDRNQLESTSNPIVLANFVRLFLLLSGDIESNPGPGKSNLNVL